MPDTDEDDEEDSELATRKPFKKPVSHRIGMLSKKPLFPCDDVDDEDSDDDDEEKPEESSSYGIGFALFPKSAKKLIIIAENRGYLSVEQMVLALLQAELMHAEKKGMFQKAKTKQAKTQREVS